MIAETKMRKGHDFHKDKGGEIVKPWPMREKTHVPSSLVLFQPLSLKMAAGG